MTAASANGGGRPARRRPELISVWFVLWLVGLKSNLVRVRSSAGTAESLAYVLPDLAVALLCLGVAGLLWHPRRPAQRWLARLLLGAVGLLSAVAYGFLLRKGSPLDWSLLATTARNFRELMPVLGAEVHWSQVLLFAVPVLAMALPALCALRRVACPRESSWRQRVVVPWALGGLCFGAAVAAVPAAPRHPELGVALLEPLLPVVGPKASGAELPDLLPEPDVLREAWRSAAAPATPPSFLFLVLESVRASATSLHAPHLPTTPFLAELARQSVVFERAYCMVPHTTKSLVSILAGHPPELRMEFDELGRLPGRGLPALLGPMGYRSAFVQTATETFERRRLLVKDLGFDDFVAAEDMDPAFEKSNYFGYEDRALIEPTLRWLRKAPGQPFLLTLLNCATHHDYLPPKRWPTQRYELADPPPHVDSFQNYLNSIACLDSVLRELFVELRAGGFLDNTVVFILGDHGEAFGEHGRIAHDDVPWEEGIHIPLVMHGPERLVGPPGRRGGLRQTGDFVPTVAELLGIPGGRAPATLASGQSLLADPDPAREVMLVAWYDNSSVVSVRGDEKLVYYPAYDRLDRFDLKRDPQERRPAALPAGTPAREETVRRMLGFLVGVNDWYQFADDLERDAILRETLPPLTRAHGIPLAPGVTLVGIDAEPTACAIGWLDVTLGLEVTATPPRGSRLVLELRQGNATVPTTSVRDANRLPPDEWRAGDRLALPLRLRIQGLAPGDATLEVRLAGAGSAPVAVHSFRVTPR